MKGCVIMKNIYCFNCNKNVEPNVIKTKNKYKINGETFFLNENIYKCPICDNEVLPDDIDPIRNVYVKYLSLHNLTFEDFKNIRSNYNLSQELFAKALCWSKKTIIRYENEESFPQREYINTYQKLKNDKMYFLRLLNENKSFLGDDYYLILKKSGMYLKEKTFNVASYMLKSNSLYKTAFVKNMFALDFYFNKKHGFPITNLKYVKAPHGPLIDHHEDFIRYMIENSYINIKLSDDDKAILDSNFNVDKKLFADDEIECMNFIKSKLKGKTATELSNWSHKFIGWKETNDGKIIDYEKYKNSFDII